MKKKAIEQYILTICKSATNINIGDDGEFIGIFYTNNETKTREFCPMSYYILDML